MEGVGVTSAPPGAAEYFGNRVALYDRAYDAPDADGHALRSRLAAVLRLVGSGPGELLDAGMGPGRACALLADRGWTVTGVDMSPEMVAVARERMPAAAGRLHVGRIEQLPCADASFDVVVATGVLEYARVDQALGELARVLRPGGVAVVSYPNPRAAYGIWKTRAWYPAVRAAKRVLRRPDAHMPHSAGEIAPSAFADRLAATGLRPWAVVPTSYLPSLTPLELVAPRAVCALASRLEGHARLAGVLATQVVFGATRETDNEGRA